MTQMKILGMQEVLWTVVMLIPWWGIDRYLKLNLGLGNGNGIGTPNHRWCVMHSMANALVSCVAFRGLVGLLSTDNYINGELSGYSLASSVTVMSLHVYHILAFRINQISLWIHHVVMMLVLTIPYFNTDNQHFLMFTDYSLFFLCGLPGMIDYYCMHLYYSGTISKLREKQINNWLNTWIRAPGILYGAFYVYRMWINGGLPIIYAGPVIGTFLWNAQFFANEVGNKLRL